MVCYSFNAQVITDLSTDIVETALCFRKALKSQ